MNIIIAGAGEVGYHLARLLTKEAHSIVLIDTNQKVLDRANSEMDLLTLRGNAYSFSLLDQAGIENTDLLIAVTSSETTNLTIATLGKQLGAKKTIARVDSPEFVKMKGRLDLKDLGIDVIISPEELASKEIFRLLRRTSFSDAYDFEFGKLNLLGLYVEPESKLIGKSIAQCVDLETKEVTVLSIERGGEIIIPSNNFIFEERDHVVFLTLAEGIKTVNKIVGRSPFEVKNIMILGGGKIGYSAAKKLSRKKNVKLIESDNERCLDLADKLPDTLVINDDGHDVQMLEDENIAQMDAFIAVTRNSETNIMSCLVAKNHGVKKTIAMVENMDYINLSQTIGIDTLINKKLIAANNIFRYVRKADIVNIAGIHGMDAEVLEVHVKEGSKATKLGIGKLKMPSEAKIGGIIRGDAALIATDDYQILADDKVVIYALPSAIEKTLELFA